MEAHWQTYTMGKVVKWGAPHCRGLFQQNTAAEGSCHKKENSTKLYLYDAPQSCGSMKLKSMFVILGFAHTAKDP